MEMSSTVTVWQRRGVQLSKISEMVKVRIHELGRIRSHDYSLFEAHAGAARLLEVVASVFCL